MYVMLTFKLIFWFCFNIYDIFSLLVAQKTLTDKVRSLLCKHFIFPLLVAHPLLRHSSRIWHFLFAAEKHKWSRFTPTYSTQPMLPLGSCCDWVVQWYFLQQHRLQFWTSCIWDNLAKWDKKFPKVIQTGHTVSMSNNGKFCDGTVGNPRSSCKIERKRGFGLAAVLGTTCSAQSHPRVKDGSLQWQFILMKLFTLRMSPTSFWLPH